MRMSDTRGFLLLDGLSARDRRAIVLGLAILLAGGLYVLGWKPYRAALTDTRSRVAAERELLVRELALLEHGPELSQEILAVEEDANVYEDRLVAAASGVLAEAELTTFLESAALRNRVLLEEIRGGELGRGEEPPPGLSVVRLHLRGESDLEGILGFLGEIERDRLLVRVRGLALEPEVARPGSDDEETGGQDPVPTGVVEFQLIVDGFARVQEYGS